MATRTLTTAPTQAPSIDRVADLLRRRRVRPSVRRKLAARFESIADDTSRPRAVLTAQIPVQRDAVRVASTELRDIARRLREDTPPPRDEGVLAARRLVTDGSGPLYVTADVQLLQLTARDVLARL